MVGLEAFPVTPFLGDREPVPVTHHKLSQSIDEGIGILYPKVGG